MSDALHFHHIAPAPTCSGELMASYISPDNEAIHLFWLGERPLGGLRLGSEGPYRLVKLGKGYTAELAFQAPYLPFSHATTFVDGRLLIASARASLDETRPGYLNGVIVDESGGVERQIHLGDGISDIAIDKHHRIWVSYFDEGVYGGASSTHSLDYWPLGSGGLTCTDEAGDRLWAEI